MSYQVVVTLQEFVDQYYPKGVTTFIPFAQATYSNEDIHYICMLTSIDPCELHENLYQWPLDLEMMVVPCISENGWETRRIPVDKLEMSE